MKYIYCLFAAAMLASCGNAEPEKKVENNPELLSTDLVSNPHTASGTDTVAFQDMPTMDFKDTLHNFGNIKEGEKPVYTFEFKNNGKTPLIISNAKGSCGCTVPSYPRDPIAPGESGAMEVSFNTDGKPGHQEKSVTITTNSQKGVHMLYIKADVAAK